MESFQPHQKRAPINSTINCVQKGIASKSNLSSGVSLEDVTHFYCVARATIESGVKNHDIYVHPFCCRCTRDQAVFTGFNCFFLAAEIYEVGAMKTAKYRFLWLSFQVLRPFPFLFVVLHLSEQSDTRRRQVLLLLEAAEHQLKLLSSPWMPMVPKLDQIWGGQPFRRF